MNHEKEGNNPLLVFSVSFRFRTGNYRELERNAKRFGKQTTRYFPRL